MHEGKHLPEAEGNHYYHTEPVIAAGVRQSFQESLAGSRFPPFVFGIIARYRSGEQVYAIQDTRGIHFFILSGLMRRAERGAQNSPVHLRVLTENVYTTYEWITQPCSSAWCKDEQGCVDMEDYRAWVIPQKEGTGC